MIFRRQRVRGFLVLLFSLNLLVGCNSAPRLSEDANTPVTEVPKTDFQKPPQDIFEVSTTQKNDLGLVSHPPAHVKPLSDGDILPPGVSLSGVPKGAFSGGVPLISLKLPADLEKRASGRRIRVTISARAGDVSGSRSFAATYSTNEVGNSGWRRFQLVGDFKPFSFEYSVPRSKNGLGDFIGFLPDPDGKGGTMEVQSVRVEVMP